jgi:hypothetical protein
MRQLRRSTEDLNLLNRTIPGDMNFEHDRALNSLLPSYRGILRFDAVKQIILSRRGGKFNHFFRLHGRRALHTTSLHR